MLSLDALKPASSGDHSLLILSLPGELTFPGCEIDCYAVPLEVRSGGMLLVIPQEILAEKLIRDGMHAADEVLFGPSSPFKAELVEEGEEGEVVRIGTAVDVLVIDVSSSILEFAREYSPVADADLPVWGYSVLHPHALPEFALLLEEVKVWLRTRDDDRSGFYTAQEDQAPRRSAPAAKTSKAAAPKRVSNAMLAEQVATLANQVSLLMQRQDEAEKVASPTARSAGVQQRASGSKLPAVSAGLLGPGSPSIVEKAPSLVGPPPRVKSGAGQGSQLVPEDDPIDPMQGGLLENIEGSGIAQALAQQSTAITALVAHLASHGGDLVGELSQTGPSSSTARGVQRREKMQSDLASGQSQFHVQFLQQLHKRLHPSKSVPTSEEALASISVCWSTWNGREVFDSRRSWG